MNHFKVDELKNVFFQFFVQNCGHTQISGSSLVPKTDDSVLFTPAGMHPLLPYLVGDLKHPSGNRLVNVQNVVRTGAINQVGEGSFLTFFELFGAWIMEDYDKVENLSNVFQFLTDDQFLGVPKEKIYITYFGGNDLLPDDYDTLLTWKKIGIESDHLCPTKKNWKGPYSKDCICGPNTRIFYDTGRAKCSDDCNVLCSCGKYVELWDVVFFDYIFKNQTLEKSAHPCIDMGAGVERIASLIQNTPTIYDTDKLHEIVKAVESQMTVPEDENDLEIQKKCRIVADHLRCSCFVLGDEVATQPSSKGRGYVLRKIMRRAIHNADQLGIDISSYDGIISKIIDLYKESNPQLEEHKDFILEQHHLEYDLYKTTLKKNLMKIEKIIHDSDSISNREILNLFDRFGVPIDMIKGVAIKNKKLIME